MPLPENKPVKEMKKSPWVMNTRLLSLLSCSHEWISLDCHTVSHWCLSHVLNFSSYHRNSRRAHAQVWLEKKNRPTEMQIIISQDVNKISFSWQLTKHIKFRWLGLIASLMKVLFEESQTTSLKTQPPVKRHLLREDAGWWRSRLHPKLRIKDKWG